MAQIICVKCLKAFTVALKQSPKPVHFSERNAAKCPHCGAINTYTVPHK